MRITHDLAAWVHATKSPLGYEANAEHAAALVARMQPGFDYAETLLGDGRAFLTGSDPSIADCTLAAFLQFMRYTGLDLIAEREQLCRWDTGYRSRPEVEDCFLM
jgi:glutathione S-transferase